MAAAARSRSNGSELAVRRLLSNIKGAAVQDTSHGKMLLLLTTHCSQEHARMLRQCWPSSMMAAPTLKRADVLLWAGCDSGAAQDTPTEYARMLAALPNANVSLVWAERLAYMQGAITSFVYPLHYGWFEPYDWVVRLNPDVLVLDERPLVSRMLNQSHASVLSNCGYMGKKITTEKIHTDFFAVRPQHLRPMANWTSFSSSAEREAGAYFRPLIEQGLTSWLPNGNTGWICRMAHHEWGSGIEHLHQAKGCGLASH